MHITVQFEEDTLHAAVVAGDCVWRFGEDYRPQIVTSVGVIDFADAQRITHEPWHSGLGEGFHSHYEGFTREGRTLALAFDTLIWVETATGTVHFEWIPLQEEPLLIKEVRWPGYLAFDAPREDWYTLLNLQQGLLIPNTWPQALEKLPFGGRMGTSDAYMPWFGQVREGHGYIAICEQPADSGYIAEHPAGGSYTHVGLCSYPSLGQIRTRRTALYTFLDRCDYNDLCKVYRRYVQEHGTFRSLREKSCSVPVEKLVGAAFVHAGIKTHVEPDSRFYDAEHPENNDILVPFATRAQEILHYHDDLGLTKLYLHLDGWGEPGYDNQHPDYPPACEAAGGWEGMQELVNQVHRCGYSFGVHDQYRDYYFKARTFDQSFATRLADGTYPEHSNWAGGHQTYLCATQAPGYVRRNYQELEQHGITLDGTYLDVFTCNEGDECSHPLHTMTRQECLDYRSQCFSYLLSHQILTSSEEVTDWSIPTLVFCHYAPYDFMLRKPGSPKQGIPVPLFNLVFHDCVVIPWMMERYPREDYMLYALLNGGAPYLFRNGSYQNTDGAFQGADHPLTEQDMADRCQIVMALHQQVAYCEMVSHRLLSPDGSHQQTLFSDGTTVTVDFTTQRYEIGRA